MKPKYQSFKEYPKGLEINDIYSEYHYLNIKKEKFFRVSYYVKWYSGLSRVCISVYRLSFSLFKSSYIEIISLNKLLALKNK